MTNPFARTFYEIEAARVRWSTRELERQIGSLLFERLAKSRDKEQAIIDHIEDFLLELGKGFCFVARQKRLTLDYDHFYKLKISNERPANLPQASDLFGAALAGACHPASLKRNAPGVSGNVLDGRRPVPAAGPNYAEGPVHAVDSRPAVHGTIVAVA